MNKDCFCIKIIAKGDKMTNTIDDKVKINLQKLDTNSNNRKVYELAVPGSSEQLKLSVSNNTDSFEKSMSTLNKHLDAELNNLEVRKKQRLTIFITCLITSLIGLAIPAYLTRNSKTSTKILSILGGTALGYLSGACASALYIMPKTLKEVRNIRKNYNIRREEQ